MAVPKVESAVESGRQPVRAAPRARVWLVALLLTGAAAALRFHRLGDWSFWVDEIFTLRDSLDPSHLYHGLTYPLSYVLIGASMNSMGVSEWSARLVPALFGVGTPAMAYLLGRRTFGELPSVIGAAIIAVSPWHLYWSQMARFYTMTVFFSTGSLFALHQALEEDRRWYAAAGGLLMLLAVLSHYSALLVLAAIGTYVGLLVVLRWPRPRGLGAANVLLFVAPLAAGAMAVGPRAVSLLSKYAAGLQTGTSFANPVVGGAYMLVSVGYRLAPAVLLLAVAGAWLGISRRDRGALLLACAVAVPAALLVVAGALSHAENRYAFVVLPPAALLAGAAMSSICRPLWWRSRVLALVVPLAVALPLIEHDLAYFGSASNGERWNYRAAASFLRAHARPGDTVYSPMHLPLAYYLRNTKLAVQDLDVGSEPPVRAARRSWVVVEDATRGESVTRELAGWVEGNCRLAAHFPASSPVANYGLSVYERQ